MKLTVGYPDRAAELRMLELPSVLSDTPPQPPLLDPPGVLDLQAQAAAIRVADSIKGYIVDVVRATRDPSGYGLDLGPLIELGASPRATLALHRSAQGRALLDGREYVIPQDVKTVARDVLRHRVLISFEADAEGITADDLVGRILDHLRVP
jgi:MoxR-like ATPase